MIIFYDKQTGEIAGTIEGRVHTSAHLNMWIGDETKTERVIVSWNPVRWFDKEGNQVTETTVNEKGESVVYSADYEPDTAQKELYMAIDKQPQLLQEYKIDVNTELLVKKQ